MGSRKTRRRERARRRRGVRKGIPLGLGEVPAYVEIEMKLRCSRCGTEYEAEEGFYKKKNSSTGYQHECKKCRYKINKQYRPGRPKGTKDTKPRKPRGTSWNHKEQYRKRIVTEGGTKIVEGEQVADTVRTFSFSLRLIIDQQLLLFYGRDIQTAAGHVRMREVLDDASFEIRDALARATMRMRTVLKADVANRKDGNGELAKVVRAKALLALKVKDGATLDEIKRAYRKLALKVHPDHGGDDREMCRLNEALRVLTEEVNAQS